MPTARKMPSTICRCSGVQTELAATAVAPSSTTTGMFGMARKIGMRVTTSFSISAMGTAAARESRIFCSESASRISTTTFESVPGFTASTMRSACAAASRLPPAVATMPYFCVSSAARSGVRVVATTWLAGVTRLTMPPMRAPPMFPAPRIAIRRDIKIAR